MDSHVIRLRGPWELFLGDATSATHVHWPSEGKPWAFSSEAASVSCRLRRKKFHQPTGLSERDRVWLNLLRPIGTLQVTCNGVLLGPFAVIGELERADLTACLQQQNELLLSWVQSAAACWPVEEVGLEIMPG